MSLELEELTGKIIGIKKAKAKSRRAKRDKDILRRQENRLRR